ncbi:MAG: helix-turn-helix domain-containing protein [Actinomycetota bacterium]|nr:MAG: helix-turn-helix domain-containing protein [Actinomycetota bacterium]
MPSDLLSLADASSILGVSPERVRQLVVAGDLPAQRVGNAWAVPMDALVARRHSARPGGRPLGAVRAWREIVHGAIDLGRPGRYQRRAEVVRCEMSQADVESLPDAVGALISGVRAAIEFGASLVAADDRDLYLSRSALGQLDSLVAAVPDSLGRIRLRVVDDDAWEIIAGGELAPRGAVALDLLDSADPRRWIAAEGLAADA